MDLRWKRMLTRFEKDVYLVHQKKELLPCYVLYLSSPKQVSANNFENALINLRRKVPTLRLGIARRDGELWFIERDNPIDFEIRKNGSCETIINEVLSHTYLTNVNPLWIARLSTNSRSILTDDEYKYTFYFGFHHSITDGTSNIRISQFFLELLNNELEGIAPTDEQLGVHLSGSESKELLKLLSSQVCQKINSGLSMAEILNVKPVEIVQLFEPPLNEKNNTNYLTTVIDCEETSKFIKLCKLHKVTFNSAFNTVINIAIANIIQERWNDRELVEIPSLQTINLRRYWPAVSEIQLGHQLIVMPITAAISKNNMGNIWHCAKEFHKLFTNLIDSKTGHKFMAYTDAIHPSENNCFPFYYTTSNIGCVDSCLGMQMPHVNVTRVERYTTCNDYYPIIHMLVTTKGKFVHSLNYTTQQASRDAARSYNDKVFEIFRASLADEEKSAG